MKELLDQMGGIKQELDKRNFELQQIGDRSEVKWVVLTGSSEVYISIQFTVIGLITVFLEPTIIETKN